MGGYGSHEPHTLDLQAPLFAKLISEPFSSGSKPKIRDSEPHTTCSEHQITVSNKKKILKSTLKTVCQLNIALSFCQNTFNHKPCKVKLAKNLFGILKTSVFQFRDTLNLTALLQHYINVDELYVILKTFVVSFMV